MKIKILTLVIFLYAGNAISSISEEDFIKFEKLLNEKILKDKKIQQVVKYSCLSSKYGGIEFILRKLEDGARYSIEKVDIKYGADHPKVKEIIKKEEDRRVSIELAKIKKEVADLAEELNNEL